MPPSCLRNCVHLTVVSCERRGRPGANLPLRTLESPENCNQIVTFFTTAYVGPLPAPARATATNEGIRRDRRRRQWSNISSCEECDDLIAVLRGFQGP